MRSVMTFAAAAVAVGLVVPRYLAQMNPAQPAAGILVPHSAMAAPRPAETTGSGSLVVPADAMGHFRTEGRIDGTPVRFMVDTGASIIALTARSAEKLGIHPAYNDYTTTIKTANGVVHAASTRLDMVEVGNLMVRDVAAVVMPDGALDENLLGLSFLMRLRHFEFSQGRLVLEQ